MPFTEDLAGFFAPSDFGTAALYTPAGSSDPAVTVNGIFDSGYRTSLDMVQDTRPRFVCAAADVAGAAEDDELVIGGDSYTVVTPEPDGTGLVTLILQLA